MQPSREFMQNFQRPTTKALTEVRPTPVVLVCIYNHNNTLITHDMLYNIFSQYGKVMKILIFEKVKVWKAFVEFETLQSALDAKRNLNDYLLFEDGTRLNVYFSNLNNIKFQNNNSGGKIYVPQDEDEETDIFQNFQNQQNFPPQNVAQGRPDVMMMQNNPFPQPVKKQDSPTAPTFDDKGDEILDMINKRQIDNKDHASTEDEEKADPDDPEKAAFAPYLLNVFDPKPIQNIPNIPQNVQNIPMGNQRIQPRPYEESDGFPRHQFQRNPNRMPTAPPGLQNLRNQSGPFFPVQNDNKRMGFPSPGSINQIMPGFSPNKNDRFVYRPGSGQELPRAMPPTGVSQFDPRQQNIPVNSFTPYSFNPMEKQGQNRIMSPSMNLIGQMGQEGQDPNEINEGSPDNLTHQNLFDQIEKNIAVELTNKMKNMEIGTGHPNYIQPQGMMPGYRQEDPYRMQNPNNMQAYGMMDENPGEDKKSPVIYVKGLEDPNINIQMVYNLFGNFGNVLKIIFIRGKAAALIEYENADNANTAKDYLNNIILLGKPLRIFYCNFSIVNMRYKKITKDAGEEILVPNPKTYRFKKNKNISINPPSATLHISNLAPEVCNEEAMKSFFGPYGTVLALQFIVKEGKWMCLMKLASIEESINIMAILNDVPFGGGRRVQLSFTRSKI